MGVGKLKKLDVAVQDQTTPPFDLYFTQDKGVPTVLTAAVAIGDRVVNVSSVTGFSIGDYVGVVSGASGEDRFYFAEILGIVSLTLTLDTPFDFPYQFGDTLFCTTRNLNVDGSVTPEIFSVRGPGTGSQLQIDVTRVMLAMVTTDPPLLSEFGDIAGGLVNGIVLRIRNGFTYNIWNLKSNYDIAIHSFDTQTYLESNPSQDINGFSSRYTFAGQDKHGVVIRLGANDSLDLIIQDNLSSLVGFRLIAEGHIVD